MAQHYGPDDLLPKILFVVFGFVVALVLIIASVVMVLQAPRLTAIPAHSQVAPK